MLSEAFLIFLIFKATASRNTAADGETWKKAFHSKHKVQNNQPTSKFSCIPTPLQQAFLEADNAVVILADIMTVRSETGWLGHYKVSHIFPLNNDDEYATVESYNGFPHLAVLNIADDSADWRTEGSFEVRISQSFVFRQTLLSSSSWRD